MDDYTRDNRKMILMVFIIAMCALCIAVLPYIVDAVRMVLEKEDVSPMIYSLVTSLSLV